MKKTLAIILSVLLTLVLCMAFTACGDNKDDADKDQSKSDATTEAVTEAPTEPSGYGEGDTFECSLGTFKVTSISEDTMGWEIPDPEGKWAVVLLHPSDDSISSDEFTSFAQDGKLLLNDVPSYSCGANMYHMTAGKMNLSSEGGVYVIFDMPADADVESARLSVAE